MFSFSLIWIIISISHGFLLENSNTVNSNVATKTEYLERKFSELLVNYTMLQEKLESLKIKYTKQEIELQLLKNETRENGVDFQRLQQEVQSVSAQTHLLAAKENARAEDFQALYHLTVTSDTTIKSSIKELEVNQSGIVNGLNIKLEAMEKNLNWSLVDVRHQIAKTTEKVAMTACAEPSEWTSSPHYYPHIIQFGDVRTQVNIKTFTGGKFTCEKEGLYLVSAWVDSNLSESEFSLYKNGNDIASAYITGTGDAFYTATAVVAVELLPNDTVWVGTRGITAVNRLQRSCLTIVKIK